MSKKYDRPSLHKDWKNAQKQYPVLVFRMGEAGRLQAELNNAIVFRLENLLKQLSQQYQVKEEARRGFEEQLQKLPCLELVVRTSPRLQWFARITGWAAGCPRGSGASRDKR